MDSQIKPPTRLARSTTIRKVQDTVYRNFGDDYRVELFGSTSYGVDTPTSDLDLVIMVGIHFHLCSPAFLSFYQDANRMDGFSPDLDLGRLPRGCILHSVDRSRNWDSLCLQDIYNVRSVAAWTPRIPDD